MTYAIPAPLRGSDDAETAAGHANPGEEFPALPASLDNLTAAKLLKLRVVLAGQGSFRLASSGSAFGAICMLPGSGRLVRLFRGFGGKEVAQMYLADGAPRAGILNAAEPSDFAVLVHRCDSTIWGDGPAPRTLPTEIRALVNRAVSSADPVVQAAVEALWAWGGTIPWRGTSEPWTPSPDAWSFIRICARSRDIHVCTTAEALKAVIRHDVPSAPFRDILVMQDTDRWVARLVSDAWLSRREELRTESGLWVRLKTRDAVDADARALGRRKEEFLDGKMPLRLTPPRHGVRLFVAAGSGSEAAASAADLRPGDAFEIWSLRDRAGTRLAMACVAQGEVIICGRDGRDLDALAAHVMDAAELRLARLPREVAEGV
jgi:hypothetical protein